MMAMSDLIAKKLGDRYIIEIVDGNVVRAYAVNVEIRDRVNAIVDGHAFWAIEQSGRYLGVIYSRVYDINVRWFVCFEIDIIDGVFREIEIPPFGIVRKALLRCKDAI